MSGIVYDAESVCRSLGLPNTCREDAPEAADDEVVVWYGGWTLGELEATDKVYSLLPKKRRAWKAPPGYYHVHVKIFDSNNMSQNQHADLLGHSSLSLNRLHVPVGATTLAVHLTATGMDLLHGDACCCVERLPRRFRAILYVAGNSVCVDCWHGYSLYDVFLGAARKA